MRDTCQRMHANSEAGTHNLQ